MKRKPSRVPDFSTRKPGGAKGAPVQKDGEKPAPVSPRTVVKPPATSSKSGRRGT
jgi:hypothetical protein